LDDGVWGISLPAAASIKVNEKLINTYTTKCFSLSNLEDLGGYGWWTQLTNIMVVFFWCIFRRCVVPEGLTKEVPEVEQIFKCLDFIGFA